MSGINYLQMIVDLNFFIEELKETWVGLLDALKIEGCPTIEKLESHNFSFRLDDEEKFRISLQGRGITLKSYLKPLLEQTGKILTTP